MSDTASKPVLPEMQDISRSSQIARMGHDPEKKHLFVQFWRKPTPDDVKAYGDPVNGSAHARRDAAGALTGVPGSVYRYEGVEPSDHQMFSTAESIGKHFGAHIKNNPRFTTTKIEP